MVIFMDPYNAPPNFIFPPIFAVPAVLSACQAPLWALRFFLRWRMAPGEDGADDSGQISIRGMLAATAIVAVVLGLCRLGLSIDNMQRGDRQYGDVTFTGPLSAVVWWSNIGITSAIALAFSAVVLPATSLLVLRAQSGILGVVFAAAYLAGCVLTFYLVFSAFTGAWWAEDVHILLLMLYLSITAYLLPSLVIFRSAGYRLWWWRPKRSGGAKL